ncbi:hypothetical protein DCAR_0520505 [Daucus carota subsp. sativus]|uniref:Uncharacterized protein n=1 Tax=Daucus carota subsp. sativus TaxID=79200 RepID=A0A164YKL7_DAUCS|nr:PREDICTED: uncharacterized N-acetyltransferase YoaA-like [Daucus carota subsp. sativus]WOH01124.1 hypothetical protein DCAR_0520505 [Daucus carota subsp. sativus]
MDNMTSTVEITLRKFKSSDVEAFMEWAGNPNVTQFCRWDTFSSKDDALNFLNGIIKSHPWYRAICINDSPIGSIYVMPGNAGKDERRGEIGYAISEKYWGSGIATKPVKMVCSCVFKELDYLDRVEALVFDVNTASQKVLEKAGFYKEGTLRKYFFVKGESRDIVVYSILNPDRYDVDCGFVQA